MQHLPAAVPPSIIEAEDSLIVAIIWSNQVLLDILEIIRAEDFFKPANRIIFAAMEKLWAKSEPIDLVTLTNSLRDENKLGLVGGAAHLSGMIDQVPLAVDHKLYAQKIREKSMLRTLIDRSMQILQRCHKGQLSFADVLAFAQSAVFDVTEGVVDRGLLPVESILAENIEELEQRMRHRGDVTGVASGYSELDKLTNGWQPSDLIILAARPAMGKTALALNMARNAAVDHGQPVAIYSLEMSKNQLSMRLLCAEARVDSYRFRSGYLNQEDWARITDAAGRLSQAPIFIDDSPEISHVTIRTKSMRTKIDHGVGLIIIDYLQLMHTPEKSERRDLEISAISRSLKLLAKELNVPVMALSQLNRKLEERSDKRPMLSDLRESGALEQDADVVAFIYRDEVYNKDENNPNRGTAEIILAKQRNGPTGLANVAFLRTYTRFEELAN